MKKLLIIAGIIATSSSVAAQPSCRNSYEIISSMPRHRTDESEPAEYRSERMAKLAWAVDNTAANVLEKAFLIMTMQEESQLARYVDFDLDECRNSKTPTCDFGRAYSVWQMRGTDRSGTRQNMAGLATVAYRMAGNHCKSRGFDYVSGAISLYATGESCQWPKAAARKANLVRIAANLCAD